MKKTIISIIVLITLALKPLEATSTKVATGYANDHPIKIDPVTRKFYIQTGTPAVLDALTVYNPTVRQCDRTPLTTASNARIDKVKLSKQEFRWMALSRNLLKRWNGKFHYGDTVLVNSGDASIDGFWVIKDTMHKRYKNYGDLLFHSSIKTTGKWRKVEITRVKSVTLAL